METPKTLAEAIVHFQDADNSLQYLAAKRWPNGVECPYCGAKEPMFLKTRRIWKCKATACRKQFSIKVGTVLNESPIGLDKWLPVMWLVANCKNGVSSCEIARDLGITQKTAWFMLHRVREAMQDKTTTKLSGEVEVDESFIGGKSRNMHRDRRERVITGTGGKDKTIALGIIERGGKVRTFAVPTRRKHELHARVRENVQAGSSLYSDALKSYDGLDADFQRAVVDHAVEYARGSVHTNTMENFWSLV
jgi:transposase-like protein